MYIYTFIYIYTYVYTHKYVYISGLARPQGRPKSKKKLRKNHLNELKPKMTPGHYNT